MLSNLLDYKEVNLAPSIATITVSTLGGGLIGGLPGALVGLCSSIADEILMNKGIEKKHHLSNTLFWSSFTISPFTTDHFSFLSPLAKQAISYTSAFALSHFTNDFLNFNDKLSPAIESFSLLNRLSNPNDFSRDSAELFSWEDLRKNPSKELEKIYKCASKAFCSPLVIEASKIISLSLIGVIADFYLLKYLGRYAKSILIAPLLEKHLSLQSSYIGSKILPTNYLLDGFKFATILLFKSLLKQGIHLSQTAMKVKLSETILKQTTTLFFEGKNGQKVKNHVSGEEICQHLINDSCILVNESLKIDLIAKQIFSAWLSCNLLLSQAPGLISPYLLTLIPIQAAYSYLVSQILNVKKEYMTNKMKYYSLTWIATNQMQQIKLRDGEEYMQNKLEGLGKQDQLLSAQEQMIWSIKNKSQETTDLIHNFFDFLFMAYPVFHNIISIEEIPPTKESLSNLFTFFSSNLLAKMDQSNLTLSIERLKKLFEILELPPEPSASRSLQRDSKLTIENYTLCLEGERLLSADHLDFELGKIYALSGPSGCGKSSFLIDLKIGAMGALSSSGRFLFPMIEDQPAKMLFLDQDLFLLPETSLLENIIFPKILDKLSKDELKSYKKRILSLFEELQIDPTYESPDEEVVKLSTKLNSKNYKLSGGQKKKIGLIQAILSKPDILFLDETFAGLDRDSRRKCQKAIKKYLPNSLVLVIDHHVEDNNKYHFYDAKVNFLNQTISVQQI